MKKLWIAMAMCLVAAAAGAEEAKKDAAKEDAKKGVAKPVSESATKAVKAEPSDATAAGKSAAKPAKPVVDPKKAAEARGAEKAAASEAAAKPAAASKPAATAAAPAAAPADGELKVEAKLCKRIENREPADEGTSFTVADGTVHAWTRVHGAAGSKVHHVWFKGDTQISDVALDVGGSPWRTYSRKTLGEESKGDWRVEIRDDSGSVLETLKFNVE